MKLSGKDLSNARKLASLSLGRKLKELNAAEKEMRWATDDRRGVALTRYLIAREELERAVQHAEGLRMSKAEYLKAHRDYNSGGGSMTEDI